VLDSGEAVPFVKPLRISSFLISATSNTPFFKASNEISCAWREMYNKLKSMTAKILLILLEF
jgi:hypothetical protein